MFLELAQVIVGSVVSFFAQGVATFPTNIAHVSQPCSGILCCIYLANPRPFIVILYFAHFLERVVPEGHLFDLSATA